MKPVTVNLFKNECDGMKQGHLFQMPHKSSANQQQFAKTMEHVKAYVAKRFVNPTNLLPIFKAPYDYPVVLEEPSKPEDHDDPFEQKKWGIIFEEYLSKTIQLQSNIACLFSLIWG
jgi:hypothetical protein